MTDRDSGAALPTPARRLGAARIAPLDGLRGLAVLAVMAFHFGVGAAPGGLLGVDVFFVLSGFLITGLLLAESSETGRVSIADFWRRRLRRLLPALLLMLTTVVVVWRFTAPVEQLGRLRLDALSTLGYVANWRFAFSGQGYFDRGLSPSPLLHMWSLAVEEQFYVFWPVLVWLVLRRRTAGRDGRTGVGVLALAGALASTCLIVLLHRSGVGNSRLYYGTDTHAAGLLVGAVTAALLRGRSGSVRSLPGPARVGVAVAGSVALAAVAVAVVTTDGESAWLYRGGFTGIAVLVATVVASVILVPASPVATLLSLRPLPQLGRISYGLYLWHWPVTLFVTHGRTGLSGTPLLVVRVLVAGLVAVASWFLVERPILQRRLPLPRPGLALTGVAAAVAVLVAATPLPTVPAGSSTLQQLADRPGLQRSLAVAARPSSGTKPMRFMLEGDSIGLTLSFGLVPPANPENAEFRTYARISCGIADGAYFEFGRLLHQPPECGDWPQSWAQNRDEFQPDVTGVLVGRWELHDRVVDGRRVHIGEPGFDDYLLARLGEVIDILSAGQRKVALLTVPCFDAREQANGEVEPQDQPAREQRWNQLLAMAAARRPDVARVFDITDALCPGGAYRKTDATGAALRSEDGIHIAPAGSALVGAGLLPALSDWVRKGG